LNQQYRHSQLLSFRLAQHGSTAATQVDCKLRLPPKLLRRLAENLTFKEQEYLLQRLYPQAARLTEHTAASDFHE
jgi:hypothetical protein